MGEIDGDGDDQLGMEPEELPLVEGQACPACGLPLTAQWLSREALYGTLDDIEPEHTHHPKPPMPSWAHRALEARAHKPHTGMAEDMGGPWASGH